MIVDDVRLQAGFGDKLQRADIAVELLGLGALVLGVDMLAERLVRGEQFVANVALELGFGF